MVILMSDEAWKLVAFISLAVNVVGVLLFLYLYNVIDKIRSKAEDKGVSVGKIMAYSDIINMINTIIESKERAEKDDS